MHGIGIIRSSAAEAQHIAAGGGGGGGRIPHNRPGGVRQPPCWCPILAALPTCDSTSWNFHIGRAFNSASLQEVADPGHDCVSCGRRRRRRQATAAPCSARRSLPEPAYVASRLLLVGLEGRGGGAKTKCRWRGRSQPVTVPWIGRACAREDYGLFLSRFAAPTAPKGASTRSPGWRHLGGGGSSGAQRRLH